MRTSITLLRIIFGFTAVPLFIMLSGCRNYYKAINTDKNIVAQSMNNSEYQQRYFILRDGSSAFYMSNITVSDDKTILHCTLDTLSPEHKLHLINGRGGNMRYKKSKPEIAVLNEVHLYIPSDANAKQGADYSLSLAKVQKVEVIEKNQGKTTASYILGGVGIAVGAFLVVGIIAIATKSSCPFVSAYDGSEMKLQGEIYGGAIYPQLARNDYLQLNMQPAPNGNLQLQISNELKEKQFTDIAELIAVTHDENVKVVADEWGNLHTVLQPQLPITATANNKNVMQLIQTPGDELNYNFNDTLAISNTLNLSFAKPAGAAKAKLVLRLKNSYWLDMVYGKFTQGFGSQYAAFIEKQSSTPVEKINEWRNAQQIPLAIDVQTSSGWQTQKSLTTFGPLANRETAVEMDISRCKSDTIHIRMSSGFMFWEIDYAAIDFSDDAPLQVAILQPLKATDETGTNVLPLLAKEDEQFLSQPQIGNAAVIEYAYTQPADSRKTQTYFLHAKGYYEHVRNYTNTADINFLQQFKQPGALSKFSMQLYKQAMNADINSIAAK